MQSRTGIFSQLVRDHMAPATAVLDHRAKLSEVLGAMAAGTSTSALLTNDAGMVRELRRATTDMAKSSPAFLSELQRETARAGVALGWFGRLATEKDEPEHRGDMNPKHRGTLPLVGTIPGSEGCGLDPRRDQCLEDTVARWAVRYPRSQGALTGSARWSRHRDLHHCRHGCGYTREPTGHRVECHG